MLHEALGNLEDWTRYFAAFDLPVLRRTAQGLDQLRVREDSINATEIADLLLADPLATAKLFAHLARYRSNRQVTEITSIEGCIVMIGVPPFFRAFANLRTVEDHLQGRPDALKGLLRVLRRSRQAAKFAWRFGVWRHDPDLGEITIAALLHDIAEVLIWTVAPDLALRIQAAQRADPRLRSKAAQQNVLNIDVHDLQVALAREWRLPELFVTMMDHAQACSARVRTVRLAVDIARHSATGWDNAALPDDYKAVAELLNTHAAQVHGIVDPSAAHASVEHTPQRA